MTTISFSTDSGLLITLLHHACIPSYFPHPSLSLLLRHCEASTYLITLLHVLFNISEGLLDIPRICTTVLLL